MWREETSGFLRSVHLHALCVCCSNELMLADDDAVRFTMGECLVHYDKDAAEERLTELTTATQAEVESLSGQVSEVKEELKKLKGLLYAKFGNSINLEED